MKPWTDQLEAKQVKKKENPKKESKKKGLQGKELETEVKPRKLRLLCIHGYRQSAKTFREKLGSFRSLRWWWGQIWSKILFRKLVGKVAELDFITAPHIIPSDNAEEQVCVITSYIELISRFTRTSTAGGSPSLVRPLMLTRLLTAISASSRVLTWSLTLSGELSKLEHHLTEYSHFLREHPWQLTTASSNTWENWMSASSRILTCCNDYHYNINRWTDFVFWWLGLSLELWPTRKSSQPCWKLTIRSNFPFLHCMCSVILTELSRERWARNCWRTSALSRLWDTQVKILYKIYNTHYT